MSTAETAAHGKQSVAASDRAYLLDCLKKIIHIRAFEQCALEASQAIPPKVVGSIHLCAGRKPFRFRPLRDWTQPIKSLQPTGDTVGRWPRGLPVLEVFGEVCQRSVGINGGRGGSAYLMAPWTRFIGENSIVGAGVPIACGVAQANVAAGNGRVVVVSIGDGAFNQGSDARGACLCRGARFAGADHLRKQRLVGTDTDLPDIQDRSYSAARLRIWHAGRDYRRHRSDRDPGHDPARRRPCTQRRWPGVDRVPGPAPLGALQPRHRALSLEGRSPERMRARSRLPCCPNRLMEAGAMSRRRWTN